MKTKAALLQEIRDLEAAIKDRREELDRIARRAENHRRNTTMTVAELTADREAEERAYRESFFNHPGA